MYRRPIRLIATVLLAILIPSLLVTSLGLLAVFQADRYVHDHVSEPFRSRLEDLRARVGEEWARLIEGYAVRLRDGDDRGAHLARLRDEPHVRDVLVSDLNGLRLLPTKPPFPELWVDLEPPALAEARRLDAPVPLPSLGAAVAASKRAATSRVRARAPATRVAISASFACIAPKSAMAWPN